MSDFERLASPLLQVLIFPQKVNMVSAIVLLSQPSFLWGPVELTA